MIVYDGMKVYMNGNYPCVCINNENVHLHRYIWIKHFGDIPSDCIVHHKDENKLNWDIDNLELLTRSEHILKHKDVVKRKGNPCIGYFNGVKYEFENARQASLFTGATETGIYRCFKGTQHQANGWVFERGGLS